MARLLSKTIQLFDQPYDARVARMARVNFANGSTEYIGWHDMVMLRRQFQKEFGRKLPGVIDCYEGEIRTTFNHHVFWLGSSDKEKSWMKTCLPSRHVPRLLMLV